MKTKKSISKDLCREGICDAVKTGHGIIDSNDNRYLQMEFLADDEGKKRVVSGLVCMVFQEWLEPRLLAVMDQLDEVHFCVKIQHRKRGGKVYADVVDVLEIKTKKKGVK